ncbi:peptide-methionine (S)-S-oxide reductase MsrA [Synechococcus sp. 1G10]|uniref:peptide-methionine (S)-S-oxide reductase MsrA n=1 Tax=Synechococcus sp. 1G10 TaxID=2025605 RepID=UPI000B996659|nr:peptide-methionine (S)-S-oxide reductase MsrA [Synechococcus sp. 1G10]
MRSRHLSPLLALGLLLLAPAQATAEPAATRSATPPATLQTAVLAGGCFWGVEGVFEHVKGVREVVSGYAGGSRSEASYDTVSSGRSGHAEAVRIRFDPRRVSYGQLLTIYFKVAHDPTQLNRQGPDQGPQYRSAIFTANPEQRRTAKETISQLSRARRFPQPIVTQVVPLQEFYPAEDYHQNFMARNPLHPYIVFHDQPKLARLRALYPTMAL